MSVSRRVINLAGALLVLVVFAAGVMLFAVPAYLQAGEIDGQRRAIETSNAQLSAEITALQKQQAQLPEIEQQLDKLREQIPSIPQLDDISALVVTSAATAQASVSRLDFGEPVAFEPNSQQVAAPLGSPSSPQATAAPEGNAAAGQSSSDTSGSQANSSTDTTQSDKLQYPVTIEVTADNADKLVSFLDELRKGPRLLHINNVSLTGPVDDNPAKVTVTGQTYLQLAPEGALR